MNKMNSDYILSKKPDGQAKLSNIFYKKYSKWRSENSVINGNHFLLTYIFVIIAFFYLNVSHIQGQQIKKTNPITGDSLTLNSVIEQVTKEYPSVKEAEEALNAADAKIGLAKAGYYPSLDFDASLIRLDPDPPLSLPISGMDLSLQLYPEYNKNVSLNLKETIYDFGKTYRNIELEKENKVLMLQTLEQVKQKLALTVVSNFYTLVYLQDAIEIKNQQLSTLNGHLQFIQKKKETGSATRYEILSTKVKISGVESQKLDLETYHKIQLSILNSLLGERKDSLHTVSKELTAILPHVSKDSLVSYAVNQRDEMKISREKTTLAELQYNTIKAQNNPMINLFVTGGWKNGYLPYIYPVRQNIAAGLTLNVPIFEGFRKKNNLIQAKSSIMSTSYETEITKRNITNEVVENDANISSALKKIEQSELQLSHAQEALDLAEINFKEGAITNLDLLDATTAVSEIQLLLLKSRIDYVLSIYKLKAALGDRLY